jgi:hypothetical protein
MDYRARFYSPALGRFIQPDTLIPDAANPQDWNRFSYVQNNPIQYNDPTGHKVRHPGDGRDFDDCWTKMEEGRYVHNDMCRVHAFEEEHQITKINIKIWLPVQLQPAAIFTLSASNSEDEEDNDNSGTSSSSSSSPPLKLGGAGKFGDLKNRGPVGDNLTPHHMPQAALGFTSRDEGGVIVISEAEHRLPRIYFGRGATTAAEDAGKGFREILAADISDLRNIAKELRGSASFFNDGIKNLIQYHKNYFPNLIGK